MSHLRHKKGVNQEEHRAEGGVVATGNPHVVKLAHEGTIGTIHGSEGKPRMDRKRGGKVHHRAEGGKVGAESHPYSSAHAHGGKVTHAKHHISHEHGGEEHVLHHQKIHHGEHRGRE